MTDITAPAHGRVLSFRKLFSYRDLWMGLAILCVIYAHAPMPLFPGCPFFQGLKTFGYGGVDVFLFSSGIGCAFSLEKDSDLVRFLKRRAERILPMYFLSLFFWFGYCSLKGGISPEEMVGNLLGHGVLAGLDNQFNWYFGCLWICYFSAPFFAALVKEVRSPWKRAGIALILCLLSVPFSGQFQLMLWTRIPVFFLGICAARTGMDHPELSGKELLLALIFAGLGIGILCYVNFFHNSLLWTRGLYWLPFALITPGLCYLLSLAAIWLEKTPLKFLVRFGCHLGKYTLSLCLTHVLGFDGYRDLVALGWLPYDYGTFTGALFVTVLTSALLVKFSQWISKCLKGTACVTFLYLPLEKDAIHCFSKLNYK